MSATIKKHYYISKAEMPDGYFLSISDAELEMVIKFETIQNLQKWEDILSNVAAKLKQVSQEQSNKAVEAFGHFLERECD